MTILTSLLADLLSSVYGYWHVWIYALSLTGYYIYSLIRDSANSKLKTTQSAHLSATNNTCAKTTIAAPIATISQTAQSQQNGDHWRRLSSIVETAARRSSSIEQLQHKAGDQLGAAELGLNRLLGEIAHIMPLPIEPTRPAVGLRPQMNTPAQAQALAA